MLGAALLLVLAQAPRPVSLTEGGWVASGVEEKQLLLWNDALFAALTERGIVVRTKSDIAQVLGVERQKQLLGCGEEESSCAAEIAQALNADGLIKGSVGKSGDSVVVNVRVLSAAGEPLVVKSSVVRSEAAVIDELGPIAQVLVAGLAAKFPGRVSLKAEVKPGLARFWWAPAAVAVAAAGTGVGLQLSARGIAEEAGRSGSRYASLQEATSAIDAGKGQELGSWVAFGVAGAAAVGTALLVWLGGNTTEAPSVTLWPSLDGAVLTVRWP